MEQLHDLSSNRFELGSLGSLTRDSQFVQERCNLQVFDLGRIGVLVPQQGGNPPLAVQRPGNGPVAAPSPQRARASRTGNDRRRPGRKGKRRDEDPQVLTPAATPQGSTQAPEQLLDLSSNQFPSELSSLGSLHLFRMRGPMPDSLGNLHPLPQRARGASAADYCRTGNEGPHRRRRGRKGKETAEDPSEAFTPLLDFSSNRVEAEILPELGSLGSLQGTSRHHLSIPIPDSLGNLPPGFNIGLSWNSLIPVGVLTPQQAGRSFNNPASCPHPPHEQQITLKELFSANIQCVGIYIVLQCGLLAAAMTRRFSCKFVWIFVVLAAFSSLVLGYKLAGNMKKKSKINHPLDLEVGAGVVAQEPKPVRLKDRAKVWGPIFAWFLCTSVACSLPCFRSENGCKPSV